MPYSGADPARKFRGSDFSNIWQSSLSWQSGVFPNCKKFMVKKVTFVGFSGGDRPNRISLDPPLALLAPQWKQISGLPLRKVGKLDP